MQKGKKIYLINSRQVNKETFIQRLQQHYLKCDTKYDNPLLNISYVDYGAYRREYMRLYRNNNYSKCFIGKNSAESFTIKREQV